MSGVFGILTLLAACGSEDEVRVYSVPKGNERIAAVAEPAGHDHSHDDGHDHAHEDEAQPWVLPDGWRVDPTPRPMRFATLLFDDESGPVEVAVSVFPADVGGMLANINRWRGQIGLGPVQEADLDSIVEPFATPRFDGALMHLQGPEQHMLAASLYERAKDQTWFVRMTTDAATAARVKDRVFAFARSFGTAAGTSKPPESK